MMKQSNDQTPIKNRGIGHPYGKNEENFSEEEEHSFGLAMDNMLP